MTASGEPLLNVASFTRGTQLVGPRLRDALWVQGCSIRCPGCMNQAYWPHVPRVRMSVARWLAHFRARRASIDGVSVLGGEPTEQAEAVGLLLKGVRALGLSTVLFSGRTLEKLEADPSCALLLDHTDLLIDGPYRAELHDFRLHWRGSSNQRMILLTERFTNEDLVGPDGNGEILVDSLGLTLHGIGTTHLAVFAESSPGIGRPKW